MITITLCILMTGAIITLLDMNKKLDSQIFEVDNLQGREHVMVEVDENLNDGLTDVISEHSQTISEIRDLKNRMDEEELFSKAVWILIQTEFPELWEKIRQMQQEKSSDTKMSDDELNDEIERQIKALDKEIENAK
jgi:cell division protein ZapA (FtsZ GTPase activity inhibitor)